MGALDSFWSGVCAGVIFIVSCFFTLSKVIIPQTLISANKLISEGIAESRIAIEEICKEIEIKFKIQDRPVKMSDFPMPIFIIATNISSKCAAIFSNSATPDVFLSDALAASVCIPVAFPVHEINGIQYIDGGIVSNLPAFVFTEELTLHPNRHVIALRIVGETQPPLKKKWRFFNHLLDTYKTCITQSMKIGSDVIDTIFTGTQDLAHEKMNIIHATLPTPLRTLNFELTLKDVQYAHEQGRKKAEKLILKAFEAENVYNETCKMIADLVRNNLNKLELATRKSGTFVRVAMAFQASKGSPLLNLPYGHGFEDRPDWQMSIPLNATVSGSAWTTQKNTFDCDAKAIRNTLSSFPHIKSRIDQNIQWILAIPIINPETSETAFVINVDSNSKLNEYMQTSEKQKNEAYIAIQEIISEVTLIGNAILETINEFKERA